MSRHVAREVAFKIIFELAFQEKDVEELYQDYMEGLDEIPEINEEDSKYIKEVVSGVQSNLEKINDKIRSKLKEDWNFERISKVDLAILRLAIYEISFRDDIPPKVSVNEAVEIAKSFGEDTSSSFVNGVLAEILKEEK